MSAERGIVRYVRQQLAEIAAGPEMWGSGESIELQYLQLLETWLVAVRPDLDERNPRHVLDAYERFRAQRGHPPHLPLSDRLQPRELCAALVEFQAAFASDLRPHNPFERNDLVLGLVLAEGVSHPSSSVLTSYVDELRRSLRGTLRGPDKRGGRSRKDIETLTEFEIPSVEIEPPNGAPARVLFSLRQRHPIQTELGQEAEQSVRDAIGHLVVAAEWASSSEPGELSAQIPQTSRRQRVAFEAMRLVPRGDVQTVQIGGQMVARFDPVQVAPQARGRLVDALAEGQRKVPFEVEGSVRAADLDRAFIRVQDDDGARHKCLLASDALEAIRRYALDTRVHVRGQRITGVSSAPLIVIDSLDVLSAPDREDEDLFEDVAE